MAIYEVKEESNGIVVVSDCLYHGEYMVDPAVAALWGHDSFEVIIPDGTTKLKPKAFYNNQKISKITIPESVTSIGSEAFWNCKALTEVNLHAQVKKIGKEVFSNTGLTRIVIPKSVTTI